MGKITVVSNDKFARSDIQKEVNSFSDNYELSFIMSYITKKYGCNAELLYPRARGGRRYIYCYFPV